DAAVAVGAAEQRDLRVDVDVDEAGRDDLAARIDHGCGVRAVEPGDRDDAVAAYPDVGHPRGRAGRSVDHRTVRDQDVIVHRSPPPQTRYARFARRSLPSGDGVGGYGNRAASFVVCCRWRIAYWPKALAAARTISS